MKVSVIIPHLGGEEREKGLKRCIDSVYNNNVEPFEIEVKVIDGPETVPQKVKKGVEETDGEYIVFLSNDLELLPGAITNAYHDSLKYDKMLVSFNEGPVYPDKGNICTHFLINRKLLKHLDNGEIFCTRYWHLGVDNYLYAQAEMLGQFMRSVNAKAIHHHFTNGSEFDEVYKRGWSHVQEDRAMLRKDLETLYGRKKEEI